MTIDSPGGPDATHDQALALEVDHVDVTYRVRGNDRLALRDVSFQIGRQESFGLVGESGSGKSTMALAITRYLPRNGRVSAGSITVNGQDLGSWTRARCARCGRGRCRWCTRSPVAALNPSIRVGRQVAEVFEIAGLEQARGSPARRGGAADGADLRPGPGARSPTRTSSPAGMLQRVVIAMALAAEPSLLILDEPTTALDATVEAEVLDLVAPLRRGIPHLGAVHQPQPRRDRQDVRPRRRDVRRRDRGAGTGRSRSSSSPGTPTRSGCCAASPAAASARTTAGSTRSPGFLPAPGRDACRLHLRRALRARRATAAWRKTPPMYPVSADRRIALPLPRAGGDAPEDDTGGRRARRSQTRRRATGDPPPRASRRPSRRAARRCRPSSA